LGTADPALVWQDSVDANGVSIATIEVPGAGRRLKGVYVEVLVDSVWGDQQTFSADYDFWGTRAVRGYAVNSAGALNLDWQTFYSMNAVARGSAAIPFMWRTAGASADTLITVSDSAGVVRWYCSWLNEANIGSTSYLNRFDPPASYFWRIHYRGSSGGGRFTVTWVITPMWE
jgi:hypothetical protein